MDTRLVSSPLLRLESSLCLILDILNCTGFSGASVYRLSSQDFVTSMRGTRAGGKIFDASIVFSWSSIWQHSSPVLVTSKSGGFIERTIIAASRLISGPSARRLSSPRTSKRFIVDCTSFSGLSVCKLSSHVPGNSGRLSSLQTELYCPHSANRRDSLAIVLASPAYAEFWISYVIYHTTTVPFARHLHCGWRIRTLSWVFRISCLPCCTLIATPHGCLHSSYPLVDCSAEPCLPRNRLENW